MTGPGKSPSWNGARMRSCSPDGHLAAEDERLGAAADARVQRADQHLAGLRVARHPRCGALPSPALSTQNAVAGVVTVATPRMNLRARGIRVMSGTHEERTDRTVQKVHLAPLWSVVGGAVGLAVDRLVQRALGGRMVSPDSSTLSCRTPCWPGGCAARRTARFGPANAATAVRSTLVGAHHRAGRDILHRADRGAAPDRADRPRARARRRRRLDRAAHRTRSASWARGSTWRWMPSSSSC